MAKKVSKSRVNRIIDMALGFGLASVFVIPALIWVKNKAGV
jgi:hypothetical protein